MPSQADLNLLTRIDVDFGAVARALGYSLSAQVVRPGQALTVTVYWNPQATTDRPYTVFVHFYDAVAGSITQRDTYPLGGRYATTVWTPGQAFLDSYVLTLRDTAPLVNGASVVFGLYDLQTMQRLPVTDKRTGLVSPAAWEAVGRIQVLP